MEIGDSITVQVPHRISGFFQIVESGSGRPVNDLAKIGSRGGGPSLSEFGTTTVKITDILDKGEKSTCKILINSEDVTKSARTSYYVFSQMTSLIKQPVNIEIKHEFNMPIGCGFGASGCGAIGTSFALNLLLNIGLSYNEAGKIAHIGEVMNRTGLGTVGGQLTGGLSITTRAGYPFQLDRILVPPNVEIVCGTFGEIPTDSIITDPEHKSVIIKAGTWAMEEMMSHPVFQKFVDVSREFVNRTKMLEAHDMEKTKDLITQLNKLDVYGASMNQLGKSVYCFCNKDRLKEVLEVYDTFNELIYVKPLKVCNLGPGFKEN